MTEIIHHPYAADTLEPPGDLPEIDLQAIREHVEMVHTLAAGCDGKLVVCSYGQDPDTGKKIPSRVRHFEIGDTEGMVACIVRWTVQPHRNVYVPLSVLRADLPPGRRGEESDIVFSLGAVVDLDKVNGGGYQDMLPLSADKVLGTSQGRFQPIYAFDKPVAPQEAKPVAAALRDFLQCDHGTADIAHVWRVSGTLNWPNKLKVDAGRSRTPQLVVDVELWGGTTTSLQALAGKLPAGKRKNGTAHKNGSAPKQWRKVLLPQQLDSFTVDLIKLGDTKNAYGGDRSEMQFGVMKDLIKAGLSDEDIACILVDPDNAISEKPLQEARGNVDLAMRNVYRQLLKNRARDAVDDDKKRTQEGAALAERFQSKEAPRVKADLSWTQRFELTEEEVEQLADPEWIYKDLLIKGHIVAIVAQSNGGRTTIGMHVAADIARTHQVVYVNADVGSTDIKALEAHARKSGFKLLLPDMKPGLSMDDVVQELVNMNEANADYSGMVFFFDTLKKMTDVINKAKAKELYKTLRGLTAKGMTIVLHADTNKYNDADGKPIYEGTGDLRLDVDDLIYLLPKKNDDGTMTVSTDPDKVRGAFKPISFHIDAERRVTRLGEFVDVAQITKEEAQQALDEDIINAVLEAINAGKAKQIEIKDHCKQQHSIGWRTSQRVLDHYSKPPIEHWCRDRAFENNSWNYFIDSTCSPRSSGKSNKW